jgi:hypothetical protein
VGLCELAALLAFIARWLHPPTHILQMALDELMSEAHDQKPDVLSGRSVGTSVTQAINVTAACMAASGPHAAR